MPERVVGRPRRVPGLPGRSAVARVMSSQLWDRLLLAFAAVMVLGAVVGAIVLAVR